jgi:hypothetical protein
VRGRERERERERGRERERERGRERESWLLRGSPIAQGFVAAVGRGERLLVHWRQAAVDRCDGDA